MPKSIMAARIQQEPENAVTQIDECERGRPSGGCRQGHSEAVESKSSSRQQKPNQQTMEDRRGGVTMGVLALQGAFKQHVTLFERIGVRAVEVREPAQLQGVDALVLPGGESTTIGLIARRSGLLEPLREWVKNGKPIWGTCAGMILLCEAITGKMKEGQDLIGGLHATVCRNFFGSQLGSFSAWLESPLEIEKLVGAVNFEDRDVSHKIYRACFIRAPVITQVAEDVKILAAIRPRRRSVEADTQIDEDHPVIVAVKQENILATSFHPELTDDPMWHSYFNIMANRALGREDFSR